MIPRGPGIGVLVLPYSLGSQMKSPGTHFGQLPTSGICALDLEASAGRIFCTHLGGSQSWLGALSWGSSGAFPVESFVLALRSRGTLFIAWEEHQRANTSASSRDHRILLLPRWRLGSPLQGSDSSPRDQISPLVVLMAGLTSIYLYSF